MAPRTGPAALPEVAAQLPLRQGEVAPRPPRERSQAHPGVHPISPFGSQQFQPLPRPLGPPPYHYPLTAAIPDIEQTAARLGKIVFHAVGDTGGVQDPEFQADVAAAMKGDLIPTDGTAPSFFLHLGDIVYYNGQVQDYYAQFYEPYDHYSAPIVAIPGNHDGDPASAAQVSLDGWVRYFMTPAPVVRPESHDAPRATMSLPNPYFTLLAPFVTIVGMYTNVPEGGSIDSVQQQWLTHELATAPTDRALIVAMHHPVYSFDDHHSGSARMADALQHAINDSRRVPNAVLAGHVHNYQRVERQIGAHLVPFLVIGNGGYYHMHGINTTGKLDPKGGGLHDPTTGARLVASNHAQHGYATLTVDGQHVSGVANLAAERTLRAHPAFDTFSYPAGVLQLAGNEVVSL